MLALANRIGSAHIKVRMNSNYFANEKFLKPSYFEKVNDLNSRYFANTFLNWNYFENGFLLFDENDRYFYVIQLNVNCLVLWSCPPYKYIDEQNIRFLDSLHVGEGYQFDIQCSKDTIAQQCPIPLKQTGWSNVSMER